jgi:hypothetical protein
MVPDKDIGYLRDQSPMSLGQLEKTVVEQQSRRGAHLVKKISMPVFPHVEMRVFTEINAVEGHGYGGGICGRDRPGSFPSGIIKIDDTVAVFELHGVGQVQHVVSYGDNISVEVGRHVSVGVLYYKIRQSSECEIHIV